LTQKTHIKKNIFFSGNLTSYRKKVINLLNERLQATFSAYPLISSNYFEDNFNIYPKLIAIKNFSYLKDINLDEIPLYEIYIPQSKSWKFSSPNRSFFSFKLGCIPICYGHFTQHPIDQLFLIKTKNPDDFYLLQKKDPKLIIRGVLSKIRIYNLSQLKYLKQVKRYFKLLS
jgi:hypothetical protein